jgi:hypothetical protein
VLEYLEYWGIGGPCAYLVPALRERGRAGGRTLCEPCACLVRARAGGRGQAGGPCAPCAIAGGRAGGPCANVVPALCERGRAGARASGRAGAGRRADLVRTLCLSCASASQDHVLDICMDVPGAWSLVSTSTKAWVKVSTSTSLSQRQRFNVTFHQSHDLNVNVNG